MTFLKSKLFKIISLIIFLILVLLLASFGFIYSITPTRFAYPKQDHYHFRLQYIFRGQAENFGAPRYQVDYIKDVCSGGLTESPIHFHDNKDQIVHLHWQKMTGGDVLKFYGLNKTGGLDNMMGYKQDELFKFPPKLTPIPIHSQSLPKPAGEDKFFVYVGEKDKFEKRDFNDFINKSLEEFLNKNSIIREQFEEVENSNKTTFNPFGQVNAYAHAGEEHETATEAEQHEIDVKKAEAEKQAIEDKNNKAKSSSQSSSTSSTKTEEELKQINNLIGNVVIFVQPNEPTEDQVKARFENLEPLGLSVCGG